MLLVSPKVTAWEARGQLRAESLWCHSVLCGLPFTDTVRAPERTPGYLPESLLRLFILRHVVGQADNPSENHTQGGDQLRKPDVSGGWRRRPQLSQRRPSGTPSVSGSSHTWRQHNPPGELFPGAPALRKRGFRWVPTYLSAPPTHSGRG